MILSYSRVSTVEQAADGSTSIDEQQRRVRGVAEIRGAGPHGVALYADRGVSGAVPLRERPAGRKMLAEARKGDVICAAKLDRLFRSTVDALTTMSELRARGVDVILIDLGVDPVTGNGIAKFFFTILSVVAEFEREMIEERTRSGRAAKRVAGGHTGGPPPLGFRVVGSGRLARLEPAEGEQEVVRQVVEVARQRSPAEACRELERRGVKTRTGRPWQIVQVQRIVERCRREA